MTLDDLKGLISGCADALSDLGDRIAKLRAKIENVIGIRNLISRGMGEIESASAAAEKRLMTTTEGRAPLNPAKRFLSDTLEAYRGRRYKTACSSLEEAHRQAERKKQEMETSVEDLEHERSTVTEQMRTYKSQADVMMAEGNQ